MCRRELSLNGRPVPPLVACANEATVAVIPGRGPDACAAAGFAPLDRGYAPARARAARLERRILAIEKSADCIPLGDLARRVQQLLDRSGWAGWTARVRRGRGSGIGPCGSVSAIGGDGRRYIAGSLDSETGRVTVFRGASRRVTDLLYSADRSLLMGLFAESGARCFTYRGLVDRIERVLGAKGIATSVYRTPHPRNGALDDEDGRWTRYRSGCAVIAGGAPGATPDSAVIQVFQRPAGV